MKAINAIITDADVQLVYDDRFLEFPIVMKQSTGGSIVFGGIVLCHAHDDDEDTNYAGKYICKVFDVVGVSSVRDLVGKPCRAIFERYGRLGDKVIGIQNYLDFSKYFVPCEELSDDEIKQITE